MLKIGSHQKRQGNRKLTTQSDTVESVPASVTDWKSNNVVRGKKKGRGGGTKREQ